MLIEGPDTPTESRYECRGCGKRITTTDSHLRCPSCGAAMRNIAVPRE